MTSAISAIQANTNASTTSLSVRSEQVPSATSQTTTLPSKSGALTEDTVQLSDSAQQYLQSSQSKETLVEQLVRAAAAGDSGALSLLAVV